MLRALRQRVERTAAELVNAHKTQFTLPSRRLRLLDFRADALARWQLQSDESIGGFSRGTLAAASETTALWSGHTSSESDPVRQAQVPVSDQKKRATKVGFCAMRADVTSEKWDLQDYHGLCVRARFDARKYILNVRADCVIGDSRLDDLYQVLITPHLENAQPAQWGEEVEDDDVQAALRTTPGRGSDSGDGLLDVRIPWSAFSLTWRGQLQSERPPAMHLGRITHVGLLTTHATCEPGSDGAFALELDSLSAFRYSEREAAHVPYVREALRFNQLAGYDELNDGP